MNIESRREPKVVNPKISNTGHNTSYIVIPIVPRLEVRIEKSGDYHPSQDIHMYPLANIHYRVKYVVFGPNLSTY